MQYIMSMIKTEVFKKGQVLFEGPATPSGRKAAAGYADLLGFSPNDILIEHSDISTKLICKNGVKRKTYGN